jgi:hypothetical protein
MCAAKGHVRFTPNSDRESGFPQQAMSALPPKADTCSALAYVCFGPRADILTAGGYNRMSLITPEDPLCAGLRRIWRDLLVGGTELSF